MKILLKKYKKLILILILPYLFLSVILVYPAKKSILTPGGLTNVEGFINIENTNELNNIYTVYVYDFYPSTFFQTLIIKNNDRYDAYTPSVYTTDTTFLEKNLMGKISKNSSINNAIIYAYTEASKFLDNISLDYKYIGAEIYYRPSSLSALKIGDIITRIDYKTLSYNEFLDYFKNNNSFILTLENGEEVLYEKNNQDIFTFYPKYEILDAYPNYNIENISTTGPSGGFMQALSIYLRLMNFDLKDIKIAGTGTIETDGKIGRIGGTKQKIYTAIDNKVDYFFMPKGNLSDLDITKYPLNIYACKDFKEAVEIINELFN